MSGEKVLYGPEALHCGFAHSGKQISQILADFSQIKLFKRRSLIFVQTGSLLNGGILEELLAGNLSHYRGSFISSSADIGTIAILVSGRILLHLKIC